MQMLCLQQRWNPRKANSALRMVSGPVLLRWVAASPNIILLLFHQFNTGRKCQKANWEAHKVSCRAKLSLVWYDHYRKCKDGNQHKGKLELMTWPSPQEELGCSGCVADKSDDLKRKFEVQFGGDEARFYKHWPQGFRWTCCGTDAGMKWGCDHHGMGSKPCSCNFCRWVRCFCSFLWSWSLSLLQGWESRYRIASTRNRVRPDMASSFCAVLIHAHSILGSLRYPLWHDLQWVWRCEIFLTWR